MATSGPKSTSSTAFITSILGLYKIDANTVGGTPANGYIRYDNAAQISAANLHVALETTNGIDVEHFLSLLSVGNFITIQDKNDYLNFQTWEINSLPVLSGSFYIFPVTLTNSGGTGTTGFANNHEVFLASFGAAQAAVSNVDLVQFTQYGGL